MGKSSSLKKKRSKVSSKARTSKRSKSRTKKNSKSKKLRRLDDSVSYSSDSDDSRSSVSVSSSSFEDGRSKRSRSRVRKDVKGKGSKKRTRRRSSSRESTEDSPPVKKRKGSKKNDDVHVKKKTHDKKKKMKKEKKKKWKSKSKRDASVGSPSSGSRSCSTCRSGDSSSDESEVEKNRGRSERKYTDRRRLEKVRSESKRRRSRSRSVSSYSRCSEYSDYRSNENVTGEVNIRRLKSVITVVNERCEGSEMDKDEHKEEMVYDHDDYPSSRSNDSNDGVSKRELVHNSNVAAEKKRHGEEAVVSNIGTSKVTKNDKDIEGQHDGSNPVDSSNDHDLETILRQKALENLKMFRKGHQTDAMAPVIQKDPTDIDEKSMSTTKAELFPNKSPKEDSIRVLGASQVAEGNSFPAGSKGSSGFSQNDKKISDGNGGHKEFGSWKRNAAPAHPPNRVALAGNPNATVGSVSNKPRLVSLVSRQESPNTFTNKKQVPALQEPPAKTISEDGVDKRMVKTTQIVIPPIGNTSGEGIDNAYGSTSDDPSSTKPPVSDDHSCTKPQDEANDGSQFEKKTMSVMRGGEMVEVSYKVYIPKKAPALARRFIKR